MPQTYQGRVIHHTKRGARFVWRVSKQTNKRYKRYLPRITQRIRPKSLKAVRNVVFVPNRWV